MVSFSSRISLLNFCLDDLSIGERGVLMSPTAIMLEFICDFMSFSVCLMKLVALTLGACKLIADISFCGIVSFISRSDLLCFVWLI
jgi:hypothetical protein